MALPKSIEKIILEADSKVLATVGNDGINAVPVSTVFIKDGTIWLVSYFFKKTAENVQDNPAVSLVCWKGTEGCQVKGSCAYRTDEETLAPIKKWAAKEHPDRTVQAVLIITPEQIYNVAATPDSGALVWSRE